MYIIANDFIKTTKAGNLSNICRTLLDGHEDELWDKLPELLPEIERQYNAENFGLIEAMKDAMVFNYPELLFKRYSAKHSGIEQRWFENASGEDLLCWWDDYIIDRMFFWEYKISSDSLSETQKRWLEDMLFEVARWEKGNILDEIRRAIAEYEPDMAEIRFAVRGINRYIKTHKPKMLYLKGVYETVVRAAMLNEAMRNFPCIVANIYMHRGTEATKAMEVAKEILEKSKMEDIRYEDM